MRLIDADALMEELRDKLGEALGLESQDASGLRLAIDIVEDTIDAEPVRHGWWVKDGDFLICLNCESEINVKNSLGVENRKEYCPNCGLKMDGVVSDGKGWHNKSCAKTFPTCLCNTCKHDASSVNNNPCCENVRPICPIENCPDYEPDDEEG